MIPAGSIVHIDNPSERHLFAEKLGACVPTAYLFPFDPGRLRVWLV
jgi:hypothetical protein